jgi:hypothetical protein
MEVKLVHPSDPDSKVVTATNEQQVAAYQNHGFVEEGALKAQEQAKADADTAQTDLQAKLDETEKELATTKTALTKAKADLKAAKEATPPVAPPSPDAPIEGAK